MTSTPLLSTYASASELFDAGLVFGRRYFFPMIRVALPSTLIGVLLELASQGFADDPLLTALETVAYTLTWAPAEAAAIAVCWHVLHGRSPTGGVWEALAPRLGAILIGYTFKWVAILVGLLVLIALGVYLMALYFAVPTVNVAERGSLLQAFHRSRALARPGMSRIVLTLGALELAGIVMSIVVAALLVGPSPETAGAAAVVAGWLIGVVLLPFRAALMTLLYVDRRVAREGYDLEVALLGGGRVLTGK